MALPRQRRAAHEGERHEGAEGRWTNRVTGTQPWLFHANGGLLMKVRGTRGGRLSNLRSACTARGGLGAGRSLSIRHTMPFPCQTDLERFAHAPNLNVVNGEPNSVQPSLNQCELISRVLPFTLREPASSVFTPIQPLPL